MECTPNTPAHITHAKQTDRVVGPPLPAPHLGRHGLRRLLQQLPRHRRHRGAVWVRCRWRQSVYATPVDASQPSAFSVTPRRHIIPHTHSNTHEHICINAQSTQMDGGRPLNKNHELSTVGASNLVAGLAGGFTGSYIFSQVRCDVLCFLCFAWSSRLLLSVFSCASVRTLP